jgi:hypothetical protein
MTLGERCDEIVRLIDETLASLGVEPDTLPAPEATVTPLPPRAPSPGRPAADARGGPDRAASSF